MCRWFVIKKRDVQVVSNQLNHTKILFSKAMNFGWNFLPVQWLYHLITLYLDWFISRLIKQSRILWGCSKISRRFLGTSHTWFIKDVRISASQVKHLKHVKTINKASIRQGPMRYPLFLLLQCVSWYWTIPVGPGRRPSPYT